MNPVQKPTSIINDCVLAVRKTITKHIGGKVIDEESFPSVIVLNFTSEGKRQEDVAALLLKALTKASCGSEKGVVKLATGEVVVDTTQKLCSRQFSKAVMIPNFSFDELPDNKTGIVSVAEAAYIRHLRSHSDLTAYAINEFPKCLLFGCSFRLDVCIGGFILFSLTTLGEGRGEKLRIFVKCINTVLNEMCRASFATAVFPRKWNELDELEPDQIDGLLDDVQLAVSDYWEGTAKDEHACVETTFLLSSIGSDLCSYYRKKIALAGGAFHCEKKLIEYALNSFDDWINICVKLTTIDWRSEWSKRYEDEALRIVRERLYIIVTLHELISEMSALLVSRDFHNLRAETLWNTFGTTDVFGSSPADAKQWAVCLGAFYQHLEPLEHRCAAALKNFFTGSSELPPQVMLNELESFHELMKRPIIATELAFERDNFLSRMSERLQTILIEFQHRSGGFEDETVLEDEDQRCQTGRFMPGVVNNIIWLRQLRHRIEQMFKISSSILSDLRSVKDFQQTAKKILEEVEDYEQEVYRDWVRGVEDQSRSLTLDADAPLIGIDHDGKVEVNYSERLVQLIKEVRIFTALNYRVPERIQQISKKGLQYYSKGISLKQIANTYNTMSEDIIPSTQAMLLKPAVAFEKAITNTSSNQLTWKAKEETDKFIQKLRASSQLLTDANRRLHKLHQEILSTVSELFGIDLHHSRHRWFSKVLSIREKIETSGFQNMDSWKVYWDMQLYKVLEAQYQRGLESLHETIGEIRADIIYDAETGQPALRPSLGSIRQEYYQHIKDFITFPIRFQGCSGSLVFMDMPTRNEDCIFSAMQHASQLFRKVQFELKRFTPLLVIGYCGKAGNPTLEEIVAASFSEVQHWEQAIRLLKQKGKEINTEELFIKCGCITLCTADIKGVVDEHLFKLTEALKQTLKHSTEKHLKSIEDYLAKVAECLDSKLTELDEISEINVQYSQLIEQRPAKEVEFHHFFNKNVLLQNMTGSAGINFAKTREIWDNFMKRLDSHEAEIEEKMGEVKKNFMQKIKNWEKDVERLRNEWNEVKPKDIDTERPLIILNQKLAEAQVLRSKGEKCVKHCQFFSLEEPDMQILQDLESEFENYMTIWTQLVQFEDEYEALRQEPWISFRARTYRFEDFVKQWQVKLKQVQPIPALLSIRARLDEWGRCVPLLKYVRGDGFTSSHWSELFSILKLPNVTQDTVLFGQILDQNQTIFMQETTLKKLHSRAQGEAQIREALDDVRAWGTQSRFTLTPYLGGRGLMLITDWKELLSVLSDHQALILSLKESPYFSAFANDVNCWEDRLSTLSEYLHYMNLIQRKWVYLEPLFRRGALPNEKQRFDQLDEQYVHIMKAIQQDNRLLTLVSHKEYKTTLSTILEHLERCQKSLNHFLETKRDSFPRFYFITDDDLLEILAQSKNPAIIQTHLRKLFMGIHTVDFDLQNEHILRARSLNGEFVPLTRQVRLTDEVETWLAELDKEMKCTLKTYLVNCVKKFDIGLHASQILCTAEMINFTRRTEEVIRDSEPEALAKYKGSLQTRLRDLTGFAGSNTDSLLGIKLKALIMDLIHNIEVVDQLIKNKISTPQDWYWRKQLRFYLNLDDYALVRMVDTEFKYSYEYQGNLPRLVHTPLTDRCYLTLMQGMQLGYGGNPYGPAGTGKTESVKALGNLLGRQVLVFNCDEAIDFKSMGRTFIGLVKCGAWGCFDEFNRLKVDQLSAISQMIQIIQEALKNGEARCCLLGREIDVDPNAGIFVTLNPAGKGYGGRSKLPDNLKQLFRSIAMSAPDNELIIETILFSEGFENAKDLSRKMVEIFNLSRQLLSEQQHYDWGLRAMKSVLRLGGALIHGVLMQRISGKVKLTPEQLLLWESEIIIKSLRANTLAKLTFEDAILFNNLVTDIFPGVKVLEIEYDQLRSAIELSLQELKLQLVEAQVQSILHLYETLQQRMGVVLVGPSGSGKTTLLKVLRKALQHLGRTIPMYVVNPKALPKDQLLGHMDPDTREWFDGVITAASKKIIKEDKEVHSWVLCDGDIDPEWVESLNSVLDDNRLLTMPNGVRVQFGNNVNFIFETHSLEHASPATVSRMGIVYLSEENVDPKMTVSSWLLDQPEERRADLQKWIADYFYQAIDSLLLTEKVPVQTTKTGLVMSALRQLHGCTSKTQFALALIYGLGSYLFEEHRRDYAKDILSLVGERAPDPKAVLDFQYDKTSASYVPYHFDPSLDMTVDELYQHPMVATVDCQRALAVMQAWTRPIRPGVYCPFILVGPEGCGKTMLLSNLFRGNTNIRVAIINCSAQTKAVHVVQKLKQICQMLNSNTGKILRPLDAEKLVLLFKDLNLPKPDKYDTVQLHSFLQQLILYSGFYDSDLEWVTVERIQVVGTMNPPGSMGRHPVSARFLAINSILCLSYPSKESLNLIYSQFLNVVLKSERLKLSFPCNKSAGDIARVMINIYDIISSRCTVDMASHYIFNPRDITKWMLNLMNYSCADISSVIEYECGRIFVDRLATNEERTKLSKPIRDSLVLLFGQQHETQRTEKEMLCFVSWHDEAPVGKKKLMPTKMDELRGKIEMSLLAHSREYSDLNLQLIPEVCSWIARVDRVLSQERANLLLIGRSGVGSAEMIRLVAYSNHSELVTLNVTREYTLKHFYAELKSVMTRAGVEGLRIVLLLEDFNFFDTQFLESINSLLSSGEVPGLFTPEEQDAMLGPLKEDAVREGFTPYDYFIDRIARFLHVAIVMDPTNSWFEPQCQSNPALFTHCNVYWLGTWGRASLKLIPRFLMTDIYKCLEGKSDNEKSDFDLTAELVRIHCYRGDRFSPQHFRALCQTYEHVFNVKRQELIDNLARLKTGVSKLNEAQENVDNIASDVSRKKQLLEVKQREADEALKNIQEKMEEAGAQKRGIHKVQKELSKEQKAILERKTLIEDQLSSIQPVLDAALSAVSSIRSEHLTELKSMKQPPPAVQDVMEAVVVLIQGGSCTDRNWSTIRKILSGDIKGQILNYSIDKVTPTTRAEVQKVMDSKANSFKPEVITRASKAAAPMADWLKAVIQYSKVLETVAPLQDELHNFQNNLDKAKDKKSKYEAKLDKLEGVVEGLRIKFGEKTTEAEQLRTQVEQVELLLNNATELLSKLSTEHQRWTTQMKTFDADLELLPSRCLLAAGFITYLGREDHSLRRKVLMEWQEMLRLTDFNFFSFLREESVQLHYKSEGLAGDELSMDNALIIQEQINTPFIEDPSGQAIIWLSNHLKELKENVEICNLSEERLVSALELALRFGKKFIITEVDHIEPFMYPLLRRELQNEGTKKVINLGDRRSVDYSDSFQLFLITRVSGMPIAPDIVSYLTPINFSVTQSGLEGQFLSITIQHEQPMLEMEKLSILEKEERLKMQLADLEQKLLLDLASSRGSLLENTSLIESLNQIKTQANEISQALEKSKIVQKELDAKRNVYRPFATVASHIFFVTKTLRELSHMYQFSFKIFMDLFKRTLLQHKDLKTDPDTKIAKLRDTFVQLVISFVSRGLLKEHRAVYAVHLSRALHPDQCTSAEWDFFIGKAVAPESKTKDVFVPAFVFHDCIETYRTFAALFPQLITKIHIQEADVWLQWMRSPTPEECYPRFLKDLTHLQRLLIMKTLRGDRLIAAINFIACKLLKVDSLDESGPISGIENLSDSSTPVLLVTTPGSDPSEGLQAMAHKNVGKDRFHHLAMGSGQTDEALRLIRIASAKGDWVFLKNLHLVIPWVTTLQKELHLLNPNEAFRLFLTTEAHDEFPSILLSDCAKVTYEAPPGIKQNLLRTYSEWGEGVFNTHDDHQKQLLFINAAFHGIIQERRLYVPQGWSKCYEITTSDMKSSADIILRQSKNKVIDWKSIRGLLESAIYGAKMETDYDWRILKSYIHKFFRPSCLVHAKNQQPLFDNVYVPSGSTYSDHIRAIRTLPQNDVPSLFSLPPNADRVAQLSRVQQLCMDLQCINDVKPESSINREEWVARLQPVLDAWKNMTASHTSLLSHNAVHSFPSLARTKTIQKFISTEMTSVLKLVAIVDTCVYDLQQAIDGTALLTENRRLDASYLIRRDIPPQWEGYFPTSLRILAWMQSLVKKATKIVQWHSMALNDTFLKESLDLSYLLRPKTFLNALRQETAHTLAQPLVSLQLVATISTPPPKAALTVSLEGLLIQGAVIDSSDMLHPIATPDQAAFSPIKKAHVAWMVEPQRLVASVSVPVYVNSSKENYLCDFVLQCESELAAEQFVLSGVSIFLE